MCAARYSAAASILSNRSRLVPGAGSPDRYRGATCSSQARLYKAPTVSLTFGSRINRKRQRCIFPPLGAHTPTSRIFLISSFGTGSGFSRRIDRVVLMISNRSMPWFSFGIASPLARDWLSRACPMGQLSARIASGAESADFGKNAGVMADHQRINQGETSDAAIRTENLHVVCREDGGGGEALSGDRLPGTPEGRTGQEARRIFPERYGYDQSTCT